MIWVVNLDLRVMMKHNSKFSSHIAYLFTLILKERLVTKFALVFFPWSYRFKISPLIISPILRTSWDQMSKGHLMAATLFFKCHMLESQAHSDATREVFPTRVTRGYYRTLVEAWDWFLIFALQVNCNSLHPQPTVVVVNHPQLARLTKPKENSENKVFVIFKFKELKVKHG
jgi:hypothetical protein